MAEKFRNKYRVASTRLPDWDYGSNAPYFVTICTRHKQHYFGEIMLGVMHLNPAGESANECWKAIPEHFPFVVLDEFVIMPKHVHGIIVINKPNDSGHFKTINKFGPQSQNFGSIVRGFKIGVTNYAGINNVFPQWQSGYRNRIIRNEKFFQRIENNIGKIR